MEKTRDEFVIFIHQAINDRDSLASQELYRFLVSCFVRADDRQEGKVYPDMFCWLIDEAAALPRKYGFAPTNEVMFASHVLRKAAWAKLFNDIDASKQGFISLEQWLSWATDTIAWSTRILPKDYLGGAAEDVSKDEFVSFIKRAIYRGTPEYRQLYFFLLKCFQEGDTDLDGAIDHIEFDRMIEAAAAAPRRFGLAPSSQELYLTDQVRLAKRLEYFNDMDTDGNGVISFNEWLDFGYRHIVLKVFDIMF